MCLMLRDQSKSAGARPGPAIDPACARSRREFSYSVMSTRCNVSHGWMLWSVRRCRRGETIVFHHTRPAARTRTGSGTVGKQPTSTRSHRVLSAVTGDVDIRGSTLECGSLSPYDSSRSESAPISACVVVPLCHDAINAENAGDTWVTKVNAAGLVVGPG